MKNSIGKTLGFAAALTLSSSLAFGGAVVSVAGFDDNSLGANDDGSTGFVDFGLGTLNFYGISHTGAFLNNNGNMTFDAPLGTFTPSAITGGSLEMIAPFFADVDTRGSGSALMTYGNGTWAGRSAFAQNWRGVGYFGSHVDKLNTFQTILVERFDTGVGNFDIYFNYDQIQWETGDASGGSNGFGGTSAHAGWTNGAGAYFEFAGSGVNGALLDSGAALTSLVQNSNVGVDGRYLFQVRGGNVIVPPIGVPDTAATLGLLSAAVAGMTLFRRRRN